MASTSIRLQHNFGIVCMARMSGVHTVMEAAYFVGLLSQIGKVRRDERGAVEARVPRLYVCVVPFVARAERGRSARICERDRHA